MAVVNSQQNSKLFCERRKFFRYDLRNPLSVLVEDPKMGEPLGLGQVTEVSTGGLCVSRLPLPKRIEAGAEVDLMVMAQALDLPLRGRLVRHRNGGFGVELSLTDEECDKLERLLVEASF
jgi:hypothetical protein